MLTAGREGCKRTPSPRVDMFNNVEFVNPTRSANPTGPVLSVAIAASPSTCPSHVLLPKGLSRDG